MASVLRSVSVASTPLSHRNVVSGLSRTAHYMVIERVSTSLGHRKMFCYWEFRSLDVVEMTILGFDSAQPPTFWKYSPITDFGH